MQVLKECWHCKHRFHATEHRFGSEERKCPRCGMGAYFTIMPEFNRRRGDAYYVHITGQAMRHGRERQQLYADGRIKHDRKRSRMENLGAWTPGIR